jgi:hypothetical protein
MKKNSDLIFESYQSLTAASSQYQQRWICDETLFRVLNAHYPCNTFNFTLAGLNCVLSFKAGPCTGPNEFGLFVTRFQMDCPYSGEKRMVSYNPPADPECASDISDVHAATNQLQRDCIGLCRNSTDWNQTGIEGESDGNTPKRAHSLKNGGSVIEITTCMTNHRHECLLMVIMGLVLSLAWSYHGSNYIIVVKQYKQTEEDSNHHFFL